MASVPISTNLPQASVPVLDADNSFTLPWRKWFQNLPVTGDSLTPAEVEILLEGKANTDLDNITIVQNANAPLVSHGVGVPPSFSTLTVPGGGTGRTTLTAHELLVGSGTSAINVVAAGATGKPLISGGAGADPAFGTLSVPGGGTGAATLAAHGVLIGEGASPIAVASPGTAGFVLTSNGASADPSFQAAGSAPVLLVTLTASASPSLQDATHINSTYGHYRFVFDNIVFSTTAKIMIRFSQNSGSTWISSGYQGNGLSSGYIATMALVVSISSASVTESQGVGPYIGELEMINPNNSTANGCEITGMLSVFGNPGIVCGGYASPGVINGVQFSPSTGNITSGTIKIYGIP